MIGSYIKGRDLEQYISYHCGALQSSIDHLDDSWIHNGIVKNLLRSAIHEMRLLAGEQSGCIAEAIHDRKTEKYNDWVEVMRLASFQYERFSQKKRARSEGLYATLVETACTWAETSDPLDIIVPGCGPGRSVLDFARVFSDAKVMGLDYSILSLLLGDRIVCGAAKTDLVRRDVFSAEDISELLTIQGFGLNNAGFYLCDLVDTTLPSCDIVVCSNTLNLLPDHHKASHSICSALRSNGLLIFADLIGWRLDRDPARKLLRNEKTIRTTFEENGIKTLDIFAGVPYIETESDDQEVIYNEHFYVGRKL